MSETRVCLRLNGRLQGVGFRPLVYRVAQEMGLVGWIKNTSQGVEIELQSSDASLQQFQKRIMCELPDHALIRSIERFSKSLKEEKGFQILSSEAEGRCVAEVLPDLAVCVECSADVLDRENRRYRYPFTNCTACGPRYSILNSLPYDRVNTTMRQFQMCEKCLLEYQDPLNRRFHAQSNCCADCGPTLTFKDSTGKEIQVGDLALITVGQEIRAGAIVAVQGIGGFHLLCDSQNDAAVRKLRQAKHRKSKPFALMVRDLRQAAELCEVSVFEKNLLQGRGAPIVLLRTRAEPRIRISEAIAPGILTLGVMLPYTPLHDLLMRELDGPVVATSGNRSEEPLCYEEADALVRLQGMADGFLVHNRPIAARIDDSVVREMGGTEVVLRSGRGYAPLVLDGFTESFDSQETVVALGSHQKSTIALGHEGRIILGPHIGNLETIEAVEVYDESLKHLLNLYGLSQPNSNPFRSNPFRMISDLHPDYRSTQIGEALISSSLLRVQHHEAHLLSCVAEHGLQGSIFGVAWDGTGFGMDGSIWGGEFFQKTGRKFLHVGRLRSFRLLGGSIAMKEPRRVALGLLFEIFGEECFEEAYRLGFEEREFRMLAKSFVNQLNSPQTSSAGRLFDGVAALLGLRSIAEYEAQPAIELEFAAEKDSGFEVYPLWIEEGVLDVVDWEPWVRGVLEDRRKGLSVGQIAAKFHRTLAQAIVMMARRTGIKQVVLSGGCFQNRLLSEWTILWLQENGFIPYWNQKVPFNDGGISVGQVMGGWNVLVGSC